MALNINDFNMIRAYEKQNLSREQVLDARANGGPIISTMSWLDLDANGKIDANELNNAQRKKHWLTKDGNLTTQAYEYAAKQRRLDTNDDGLVNEKDKKPKPKKSIAQPRHK